MLSQISLFLLPHNSELFDSWAPFFKASFPSLRFYLNHAIMGLSQMQMVSLQMGEETKRRAYYPNGKYQWYGEGRNGNDGRWSARIDV